MRETHRSWLSIADSAWAQRIRQRLDVPGQVSVVYGPRDFGLEYVLGALRSPGRATVWTSFDEHDFNDPVSQGVRVVQSLARSLGAPTFGYGVPCRDVLKRVAATHGLLGPYAIIFSGLAYIASPETIVGHLAEIAGLGSVVVLHARTLQEYEQFARIQRVHSADLDLGLVQPGELAAFVGESRVRESTSATLEAMPPASPLLDLLRVELTPLELETFLVPSPVGATMVSAPSDGENPDPVTLADSLMARGLAIEALEVLARTDHAVDEPIAEAAGREYARRGMFARAFRVISGMSVSQRSSSDSLMRWFFASATAVNEHESIREEVADYLKRNEAPELRALFAAAVPGSEFLSEARRAVESLRSPVTLRIAAFAELLSGSSEVAVELMHSALRISERLGDDSMVVASATDLSDYWSREGQYRVGVHWAEWALAWYWRTGCQDELRRGVAESLLRFNRLLVGDEAQGGTEIDEVDIGLAGIPTSEVVLSTAAELAFVRGDLATAEHYYRALLDGAPLPQMPGAAVDLVHVLASRGSHAEATDLGYRARSMSLGLQGTQRVLGRMAAGLSRLAEAPAEAAAELEYVVDALSGAREAPRLAQAAIALAIARYRQGDIDGAGLALSRGDKGLRELGSSGWTLLGGPSAEVHDLRRMYSSEVQDLFLGLLGGRSVRFRGRRLELGLRQLEVLVALGQHPAGLSAERLGDLVYGEEAQLSTIKAIVSRLRQVVPILSRPYRVDGGVGADFVIVQRLLSSGRVREAVAVYRGPLLPESEAPLVVELRGHLEELVKRAVLASGDVEMLVTVSNVIDDDPELLEALLDRLSPSDSRVPLYRARRTRIARAWSMS